MKFKRLLAQLTFSSVILGGYTSLQADQACCAPVRCEPECCSSYEIGLKGSYLYWGVQEDQLGFAVKNATVLLPVPQTSTGKLKSHNPKWDSGVRVEAELAGRETPVGIHFGWTHFSTTSHAKATNATSASIGVTTADSLSSNGTPFPAGTDAFSTWRFKLNEYALDFAYLGFCRPCFKVRPYVGVLGATVDQHQWVNQDGISFRIVGGSTPETLIIDIEVSRKSNFWGVGPRFGVGFTGAICDHLSFITDVNAAFLVGRFKTINNISVTPAVSSFFMNMDEHITRARPMLGGQIGFEWKQRMFDCMEFMLGASYECQYWFQQWHSCSNLVDGLLSGEGRWGDMSIHGLVVTGGFTF